MDSISSTNAIADLTRSSVDSFDRSLRFRRKPMLLDIDGEVDNILACCGGNDADGIDGKDKDSAVTKS